MGTCWSSTSRQDWWCIPARGIRGIPCKTPCWGWIPKLAALPRAGLIHRLDKDTSGLLVVARNAEAQTSLSRQLMARTMSREYLAVCVGVMTGGGTIDAPIGRNRSDRLRMAVRESGRPAVTHYRVLERFRAHTHISVKLETGRTHQIRLHLSHQKYPIVGDPVYGGRFAQPRGASQELIDTLRAFKRQALHAATFGIRSSADRQAIEPCKVRCRRISGNCCGLARGCAGSGCSALQRTR